MLLWTILKFKRGHGPPTSTAYANVNTVCDLAPQTNKHDKILFSLCTRVVIQECRKSLMYIIKLFT